MVAMIWVLCALSFLLLRYFLRTCLNREHDAMFMFVCVVFTVRGERKQEKNGRRGETKMTSGTA